MRRSEVIRHTGAYSDADSMVLFRKADVIATGDLVDLRHFPVIDPAKGGSIQGELDALNRPIAAMARIARCSQNRLHVGAEIHEGRRKLLLRRSDRQHGTHGKVQG